MPNAQKNQWKNNPAWKRVQEIDEKMQAIRKKALALRDERIKLVGEIYGCANKPAENVQRQAARASGNR